MTGLLCFVLTVLVSAFKSKSRLEAANAALRHQLIVLRRKVKSRPQLTNNDRWFFVQLYRWFPSILQVLTIIRPDTLVRWHQNLVVGDTEPFPAVSSQPGWAADYASWTAFRGTDDRGLLRPGSIKHRLLVPAGAGQEGRGDKGDERGDEPQFEVVHVRSSVRWTVGRPG
jgi:hypothetical protein